jgi:hypothetical protein
MVKGGTDFKHDVIFFGEFDRARLHDLGAAAGELEHLVVADLVELAGILDDARIGGVDAVNVGIDFALVGPDSGGEGDGGEVGSAPAESGDLTVLVDALEAGDDDDPAGLEVVFDRLIVLILALVCALSVKMPAWAPV